jgi:crossover junction endodeoxyribonuclease RusA
LTVIDLPPPPSLNNLFLNVTGRGRVLSGEYRAWRMEAGGVLKQQKPAPVLGQVMVKFEHNEKCRIDPDNLLKAPFDLLVEHKIIAGDGPKIVRGYSFAWSSEVTGMRVTVIPVSSVTSPV